jgi:phenylalanyl-tRNA synthetase beta chain
MRISWNWLSELVDLSPLKGPEALADLLTQRGLEVEALEKQNLGLEHVVTAQIIEFHAHPQADRLNVCQVRNSESAPALEIVCGAKNLHTGAKVALAQIGALLPNGVSIARAQVRGIFSNGMLCSATELKLPEPDGPSDGILILPDSTALGIPLADFLGRNDTILNLKMTANRGDCLSHIGIAREVAAALGSSVRRPAGLSIQQQGCGMEIQLNAGPAAPQFYGCTIEGVRIGPSPKWLVQRLEALGARSINNVVDATNWVMFECGHPMHAYDAKQIRGKKVQVRLAQAGESLPLLDGQTLQLKGFELVIADEQRSIALAGVMGGGNSQVSLDAGSKTQDLFLECAEFSPELVRKAAAVHQHKTDASHRFERGVDPQGLVAAAERLAHLIVELAGGKILGASYVQRETRSKPRVIEFGLYELNDFLGFPRDVLPLSLEKIEEILIGLQCQVKRTQTHWSVEPPSFRLDLGIKEDIAEELARSIGYDAIPITIPPLSSSPVFAGSANPWVSFLNRTKESLVLGGLLETINFAFSSRVWLAKFGLHSSVPVLNPLSEECAVMVPSLIPGLIRNVVDNWNHHFGSEPLAIRLFELRPVFSSAGTVQAQGEAETGVQEKWKLAFVISGPRFAGGLRCEQGEVDFYDLKGIVQNVFGTLGTRGVRFHPLSASKKAERAADSAIYHPGKSVEVLVGNASVGHFGFIHPGLAKELKMSATLGLGELDWESVAKFSRPASRVPSFAPWPSFPPIERDFALLVKNDVTSEKLCQVALKTGKPLAKIAKVFDIYQGNQIGEGMTSVAVRVIFYDEHRSLQEAEAEAASTRILESWKREFGVELRS